MPTPAAPRPKMLVIGLTGGIGMGKSTAARILSRLGFPVYHADRAVHDLLGKHGKAIPAVRRAFPESLRGGAISRKLLGRIVFDDPAKLRQLENILHPLVQEAERSFLREMRRAKVRAVFLEIPLLFETGAEARCDAVLCVTAPRAIQKARVLSRRGMTEVRLRAILKRQLPDLQKRRRADYIIHTGKGLADTRRQLVAIIDCLLNE
ncbi:MAG: dephospho-CoA kinase [Pseudomonadota bacterium]|nr:dephospho-CoA kinase [Pseudomonadota bacterium]